MTTKRIMPKPISPSLFSYRVGSSLIHKISAGIKLILMFAICICVFYEKLNAAILIANGILVMVGFFAAETPISRLKKIKFVFIVGLFVTAVRAINFTPNFSFSKSGLMAGLIYTARLSITAIAALVVFETTTRRQIQEVFEKVEIVLQKIFPPLKKVRLALMISTSINFIPEIFSVWNQIQLATFSKMPAKKLPLSRRISVATAQIFALFSCMLERAEETRKAIVNKCGF